MTLMAFAGYIGRDSLFKSLEALARSESDLHPSGSKWVSSAAKFSIPTSASFFQLFRLPP